MHQLRIAIASIVIALSTTGVASAQLGNTPRGIPPQFTTIANIIESAFNITIVVSGVIFVLLLLLGGVQYLTSLGNEDAVTKSRKLMINGAIGLVIVLVAFALGNYVLNLLGIGQQVNTSINSQGTTGVR